MGTLVADRIDRPLSLFDEIEALAPARVPEPARAPAREPEPEADEQPVEAAVDSAAGGAAHVHDGVGGEPTLDDLVVRAWEGLAAQAAVSCPLCTGTLRPVYADAAASSPPTGGRCDTCGTTLS